MWESGKMGAFLSTKVSARVARQCTHCTHLRLPSLHASAPPAVICSDKTGTLTTNQMSAVQLAAYGGSLSELTEWEVTG